jgi:hypothetical protein
MILKSNKMIVVFKLAIILSRSMVRLGYEETWKWGYEDMRD